LAIAGGDAARAVVPVHRFPASGGVGVVAVEEHRDALAVVAAQVEQVVVHVAVVAELRQVRLPPVDPIIRLGVCSQRGVWRAEPIAHV